MHTRLIIAIALMLALPLKATSDEPYTPRIPLGLDGSVYLEQIPTHNPLTRSKVALGRYLFFDKRLSKDGTVACGTCHQPRSAFTDGQALPTGIGGQKGQRNAPTILNRVYGKTHFYDGRAASLEDQALLPIQSPSELGNTLENVVATLSAVPGYRTRFKQAFGTEAITPDRIARAIAAFERSLITGESPFDLFEYGGPEGSMSEAAIRGLTVFRGKKTRCPLCHTGFNYTDEDFHNIGLGWDKADLTLYEKTKNPDDIKHIDPGRYALTKDPNHFGAIKTPTLREVARTAPYMHNGSVKTLEEIVDFYNKGGVPNPFLDEKIKPLNLTDAEKEDLVAFLRALSGTNWLQIEPPLRFPK
ncbi:MAG: cytochrome-c peroxidase [bacterium]|nr:cytochrome-c peroxidase [bacterium]